MREEYSPYKAVHHRDRIDEIREGIQPNPIHVQVVLTNRCNHKCRLCAYRLEGYPSSQWFRQSDEIPLPKALELIDSFGTLGVKAVQFTGGGEPFLYPGISEVLDQIIESDLDFSFVTNGTLVRDDMIERLSLASWVRVSLDAGTPKTYGSYRGVKDAHFGIACRTIEQLSARRKQGIVGVGFVVNEWNYQEIYQAGRLAKGLGANNFRISAAFQPEGISYFRDFVAKAKGESRRVQEELTGDGFEVFNLFNDRIGDLFEGHQKYRFCPIKELQTYIGADQNVYMCCTLAYNERGLIGSIQDQDFVKLWRSEKKQARFVSHNPSRDCPHPCMYQGKNEFMNYCLKENPRHVNFV